MTDKNEKITISAEAEQDQPQKKRWQAKSWQLRLLRNLAKLGGFVLISLAVIICGIWLYVQQAGGLKQVIERQLTRADLGLVTRLDQAELGLFRQGLSAEVRLHNVTFTMAEQTLQVPNITLQTSAHLIVSGVFWQMAFERLALELVQQDQSFLLAGDWGKIFDKLAQNKGPSSADAALAWVAGQSFVIKDSEISLIKKAQDARLSLKEVDLALAFDADHRLKVTGQGMIADSDQGTLRIDGLTNLRSGFSEVAITTYQLPLSQFDAFLPASLASISSFGALDSDISFALDGAQIETATGTLIARRGTLIGVAAFSEFSASLGYSRTDDYFVLSDVHLLFPDGRRVAFDGSAKKLQSDFPTFSGTLSLQEVPIDGLLSQWPEAALPDVRAYMIGSFSQGAFKTISMPFTGQFDKINQSLSLSEFALLGTVDRVRVQTGFGHYSQIVGTANAELALEVMSGGVLKDASVKLALSDGFITTKDSDQALHYDNITGQISYQPGRLYVPDMQVSLQQNGAFRTSLDLGVADNRSLSSAAFELTADSLSLAAFQQLFPPALAQRPADYLKASLSGGRLRDLKVQVATSAQGNKQVIDQLQASARLEKTAYQWLSGQSAIDNVSALISLDKEQLEVVIDEGQSQEFLVRSALVTLSPLVAETDSRMLDITFDAQSTLPQLQPLLDAPQLSLPQDLPVDLARASGDVRASVKVTGIVLSDGQIDVVLDEFDGVITDAFLPDMIDGDDLHQADIVISYDNQTLRATGAARYHDIAGDFSLIQNAEKREITAVIAPQEAVSTLVNKRFEQQISGPIGARLVLTSSMAAPEEQGDLYAVVSVDLSGAGLYVPLLDWGKLQNEPANASARFIFKEGMLQRIDKLVVSAYDFGAKGAVEMTQTGTFAGAYLHDLRWPGNQIDEILIETDRDGALMIFAQGPQMDLRQLRKNDATSNGLALSFDVTSERLIIEDKVSLFGQMTGRVNADGNGSATLQGALVIDERPLLEEGTIDAVFGADGEYLSAVGLIGGAEARLEFSPDETGNAILIITSQNAGRVLSGLGVTDTIRSGRLVLSNEFKQGRFDHYETTINLEEFNVIEAPAAVRAFSVLGLAGLYSLVEGDGTRFTTGEAKIETKAGQHIISKMVASGGAVGVSLVGEYDSNTRKVDVSGNLVPVNQFSKLIGAVPLVGELLSGVDNAGIFATQFNITGTIDDPETSVNAASLVPGIIRDIFSPDWLGRESERIIGGDQDTN